MSGPIVKPSAFSLNCIHFNPWFYLSVEIGFFRLSFLLQGKLALSSLPVSHSKVWLNKITGSLIKIRGPGSVMYLLNWVSWRGRGATRCSVVWVPLGFWWSSHVPAWPLWALAAQPWGLHVPGVVSSHLGYWTRATLPGSLDFYVWPQILFLWDNFQSLPLGPMNLFLR